MDGWDEVISVSEHSWASSHSGSSISRTSSVSHASATIAHLAYKNLRYRFPKFSHYMITAAIYAASINCLTDNGDVGDNQHPNLIQYIVSLIVICLPIMYMQVFMGQYTQISSVVITEICPFAGGLGYCMLINSLFRLVLNAILGGDSLLYLLTCMQKTLPWSICPPKHRDICWVPTKCPANTVCVTDTREVSTYIYWNYTFMETIPYKTETTLPNTRRFVTITILWLIIYGIVMFGKKIARNASRVIFLTGLVAIILLILVMYVDVAGSHGAVEQLFEVKLDIFMSLKIWIIATSKLTVLLGIGRCGYVLFGSYIQMQSKSANLSVLVGIFSLFFNMTCAFFFYETTSSLMFLSHAKKLSHLFNDIYEYVSLTIIPSGIYMTSLPHIWSALYFFACVCLIMGVMIVNLCAIEETLGDANVNIHKYRKYLISSIILIGISISLVFVCKGWHAQVNFFFKEILDYCELVITWIFSILVSYVYGIQRFSDDIHFAIGTQPAKYWKLCWFIAPMWLSASVIMSPSFFHTSENVNFSFAICIIAIILSPILIGIIMAMFKYILKRNLVGVIRATDDWGPADVKERHVRSMFNPRKETKIRRRDEQCRHKCLLGSKILQRVHGEECRLREAFLQDQETRSGSHEWSLVDSNMSLF